MPRRPEQFPARFNELSLQSKYHIVHKALSNTEFLNKIIDWLKDTERFHNQEEDEGIILYLYPKLDKVIANGILLPPPLIDHFNNTRDYIAYIKTYSNNPHRDITESELKQIIRTMFYNWTNRSIIINALIDNKMLPPLEPNNSSYELFKHFEYYIEKPTIDKLFQYFKNHGGLSDSIVETLLVLFKDRLNHWQRYKERMPRDQLYDHEGYTYNIAIANYTHAINYLNVERSKEIYTTMASAGPNSHLSKLPYNLFPEIIEGVTGMKRANYIEELPENIRGGSRRTSRKSHRASRKSRRASRKSHRR